MESDSLSQRVEIVDLTIPFSTINMAAGSTIMIKGELAFESDKPLECITLRFKKEEGKHYNYYSCKTCNVNCKP